MGNESIVPLALASRTTLRGKRGTVSKMDDVSPRKIRSALYINVQALDYNKTLAALGTFINKLIVHEAPSIDCYRFL